MGRWYNPFMTFVLRSPLHGLLDKGVLLITVTGRKSGRAITTPVNYLREDGTLWITSLRERTWWRNLRGGAPVTVHLQGRDLKGTGQAIADDEGVAAGLAHYLERAPQNAKYYGVALSPEGKPKGEDIARAARDRVMVEVQFE